MARRYTTTGDQTATALDSIVSIDQQGTTIRPILYYVLVGHPGAPADQAVELVVGRFTVDGTYTSVTSRPFDPGDPAALIDGGSNHTVEPTYTADFDMLSIAINQQATYVWQVPPDEGIVIPATADNGLGLYTKTISGGTPEQVATLHHQE